MKRESTKILLLLITLLGTGILAWLFAGPTALLFRFLNRAAEIPEAEWKQFAPEDGGFVVLMPGRPALQPKQEDEPIQFTQFLVDRKKEAAAYLVGYVDIPETELKKAPAEERLGLMVKAMADRYPGSVVKSEGEIAWGDVPGRELSLEVPGKGTYILRVYAQGRRIFLLVIGGPSVRADSKDVQKFFGFFTILGRKAPSPMAGRGNR
jgi:hypothetical protein